MDTTLLNSYRFFREHAGYIVGHSAESALSLARAELLAASRGMRFEWSAEDWPETTATDEQIARIDAGETVYLYCLARLDGEIVGSLGGIEVYNSGDPYCRVVEAELALEAL
jgi:hypothetical protein